MSLNRIEEFDGDNQVGKSAGVKGSTDVNLDLLFENRMRREWLTTKEAAQYLLISENALRIMAHRLQIPVYKFGRRLRFRFEDCRLLVLKKGA
jgi:excisionase family DNA binding protein